MFYVTNNPVIVGGIIYALFRQASQSSTISNRRAASEAEYGISDNDDSFMHTGFGDYSPWWKVQLAYPTWVREVEITNRISLG